MDSDGCQTALPQLPCVLHDYLIVYFTLPNHFLLQSITKIELLICLVWLQWMWFDGTDYFQSHSMNQPLQ